MLSPDERFWNRVEKTETCWLWSGKCLVSGGYGVLRVNGKDTRAHRFSYELHNGPIPDGLVIDHMCHVTNCVNPDHLRAVTNKQNSENVWAVKASSGVRGVSWHKGARKWMVQVRHDGKNYYGGLHNDIKTAERVAIALRSQHFTHSIDPTPRDAIRNIEAVAA